MGSSEVVTTNAPPSENEAELTEQPCPYNERRHAPDSALHSFSAVAGYGDHQIATAPAEHELNDSSFFDSETERQRDGEPEPELEPEAEAEAEPASQPACQPASKPASD
jgi:hypothetical protein